MAATLLIAALDARHAARSLGLQVTGVLGVLRLAKENGLITRVAPVIEQMLLNGYRFAPSLLRQFLRDVGELNA